MSKRSQCLTEIIGYSALALVIFLFLARRGLPLARHKLGFIIAWASAALPVSYMQMSCIGGARHNLVFHILPMVSLGVIMGIIAIGFLKMQSKRRQSD